jgi:hypothetical protein
MQKWRYPELIYIAVGVCWASSCRSFDQSTPKAIAGFAGGSPGGSSGHVEVAGEGDRGGAAEVPGGSAGVQTAGAVDEPANGSVGGAAGEESVGGAAGAGSPYAVVDTLQLDEQRGLTAIMPFRRDGSAYLLSYRLGDGDGLIEGIPGSGSIALPVVFHNWVPWLTHFVTYEVSGLDFWLCYGSHNGVMNFTTTDYVILSELNSIATYGNFTSLASFGVKGNPVMVFYDQFSGDVLHAPLTADGAGFGATNRSNWRKGITDVIAFESPSQTRLMLLEKDTSQYWMARVATDSLTIESRANTLPMPVSLVTAFSDQNRPFLFAYDSTGTSVIYDLADDGSASVAWRGELPAKATRIASYVLNDERHLMLYYGATGHLQLYRIDSL